MHHWALMEEGRLKSAELMEEKVRKERALVLVTLGLGVFVGISNS